MGFGLAATLLAIATAIQGDASSLSAPIDPALRSHYPLSAWLIGNTAAEASTWWVILTAAAAALAMQLFWSWTGNRIVSLLGGLVWALHPVQAHTLGGGLAIPAAGSAFFLFLALLVRERGWARVRLGGSPLRAELAALGCVVVAAFVGPNFLAYPAAVLLIDAMWHRADRQIGQREIIPRVVLLGLVVLGLWHCIRPDRASAHPSPGWFEHAASVVIPGATGAASRRLGVGLLILTALALPLALRSQARGAPKITLVMTGFAGAWLVAVESCGRLGWLGGPALPSNLGPLGLSLAIPSLLWRALLSLSPEPTERFVAPRELSPKPALPALPGWPLATTLLPAPSLPSSEATFINMVPAVRDAIDAAVGTAVESSVGAALRAARALSEVPPSGRLAKLEREWRARAQARASVQLQARESTDAGQAIFFRTYLEPLLAPEFLAVEIGPRRGAITVQLLPRVREVLAIDESTSVLSALRADLAAFGGLTILRATPENSLALAPGSADVIVAAEWFTVANLAAIHRGLHSTCAWLKPGGVAAIAFANFLDPVAQRSFLAEAESGQAASRTLVTPEMVRTLAELSGLAVRSLHLAADGRDLWVLFERRATS